MVTQRSTGEAGTDKETSRCSWQPRSALDIRDQA
jgi:hypothetical protein